VKKSNLKREPSSSQHARLSKETEKLRLEIENGIKTFWEAIFSSCLPLLKDKDWPSPALEAAFVARQEIATPPLAKEAETEADAAFQTWRRKTEEFREQKVSQLLRALDDYGIPLRAAFTKHGIDFRKEIFPIFHESYRKFIEARPLREAENTSTQRRFLKRYEGAVRLIAESQAPFSPKIKKLLKEEYDWLKAIEEGTRVKAQMTRIRETVEELEGKVLDASFCKEPLKHPLWQALTVDLSEVIKGKGVSDRQAAKLIVQLFKALLPDRFYSESFYLPDRPEEAIRQTIKRGLQKRKELKLFK
jgi:hypothetical protein